MCKILSKPFFSRFLNFLLLSILATRGYASHQFNFHKIGNGEKFFVKNILAPSNPKICIDIGANQGDYSKILLENTNSIVYSFEPLPEPFKKISKLVEIYKNRLIVINKGLSNRNEKLTLYYDPKNTPLASFSKEVKDINFIKNDSERLVNTISLDHFCKKENIKNIDFIKIDTEGFEYEVLEGSLKSIKKFKPKFIQIEMNIHQLFRNNSLKTISKLLPNYSCYQLVHNNWIIRDPKDALSNLYFLSNFVFALK